MLPGESGKLCYLDVDGLEDAICVLGSLMDDLGMPDAMKIYLA